MSMLEMMRYETPFHWIIRSMLPDVQNSIVALLVTSPNIVLDLKQNDIETLVKEVKSRIRVTRGQTDSLLMLDDSEVESNKNLLLQLGQVSIQRRQRVYDYCYNLFIDTNYDDSSDEEEPNCGPPWKKPRRFVLARQRERERKKMNRNHTFAK
jgi:hypothetical protein